MKIIFDKNKLKNILHKEKSLGFVPTMGGIHLGHLSLIKKSNLQCKKTIVSIYINKPQFNAKNDYKKYPRTLNKDINLLKKNHVNYLYLPKTKQIYPSGVNKKIKINSLEKKLCGKSRPGHFKAVVDIVDRLIKIIKPKRIYLGEKDFQQLKIIEDFIKKNKIKTKVIGCKTIRESSGIAYSSRNKLLNIKEKNVASNIYNLIIKNKEKLIKKNMSLNKVKKKLFELGGNKIDYIEIINVNKLIKPYKKRNKFKIFIAYYVGSTRLIDNI